ncbi:hypothetical protein LJC58_03925 [Lachnospiraceae bacterium OttesenSCG-928-D06]|nr:hypothetical protein [Lachnospiraceae bacterium OttesenSCG-928-D06]
MVGISVYPSAVGTYRVTATKPVGLPTNAQPYGVLMIYGIGQYAHIYTDLNGDVYVGRSSDVIIPPANWNNISAPQEITLTRNTAVTNGGTVYCYKIGHMVHVQGFVVPTVAGTISILSGLPAPRTRILAPVSGDANVRGLIDIPGGATTASLALAQSAVSHVFNFSYIEG